MKDLLTIIGDGEKIAVRVTQSEAEVAGLNTEISEMEDALAALRTKGEEARGRMKEGQEEFQEFIANLPEGLDADKAREMIDTRVAQLADMGMLDMVEVKPKRRGGRKKSTKKEDPKPKAEPAPEPQEATTQAAEETPVTPTAAQTSDEEQTTSEEQATTAADEDTSKASGTAETEAEAVETSEAAPVDSAADTETAEETSASEEDDTASETDFLEAADADGEGDDGQQQPADEHDDLVNELAEEVAGEGDDGAEQNVDEIAEMAAKDGAEEDVAETGGEAEGDAEDGDGSGPLDVDFPSFLRETA